MADVVIHVDPAALYLPPSRRQGADREKFVRQFSRFGDDLTGMPPLWLTRGADGRYRVTHGVTRASRAAKLRPGATVPAVVIADLPGLDVTRERTIAETVA